MIRFVGIVLFFLISFNLYAQNSLEGKVIDDHSGEPVPGVNIIIEETGEGTSTGLTGEFNLTNIKNGKRIITFSHIAYKEQTIELIFPLEKNFIEIELEEEAEETDEIFVNATRSTRTIENEPTRVEIIAGEEIDEKISMDPSNISMMLNESTGIQVQQTSAASANNSFRIQGLDGRFTQLLKDGFPLYSGFSGSLSIVQIPPLDLKQIEIIKGSSSTLYGGGAIAGLINLISKEPKEEREISFLLNGTSALGLDASGYYSARNDEIGLTLLSGYNYQKAYDNNDDKFSDLPEIKRYVINPKIYFYINDKTKLEAGINFSKEERTGGALPKIEMENDPVFTYFERNKSERASSQLKYETKAWGNRLVMKNSIGYFNRELTLPEYVFNGEQLSTYTEAAYSIEEENSEWIAGVNLITEKFDEKESAVNERDIQDITGGIFIQNNLQISEHSSLETGMRADHNSNYGWFYLPRIALLNKWSNSFSTRIGGGLGYKIPTIFTEAAEEIAFRGIEPIDKRRVEPERSYGANLDLNYSTVVFDELSVSINQLFYYTRINDPLTLIGFENLTGSIYEFFSVKGYIDTKGIETNLKLTLDHYKLFAGYSYADVEVKERGLSYEVPLTPKHRLGLVLIYEKHGNFRIGLEAYYTGKQKLADGSSVTDYWVNGVMIEKRFKNISLFLNFENIFDTRQSRYGSMYRGSPSRPLFESIYAPTDGRIINGGIKIRL